MKLFAIRDLKAQQYGPLTSYKHEAVAVRELATVLQEPKSLLRQFPDDYELHELGELTDSGIVTQTPRLVVSCSALLAASSAPNGQLSLLKEA